MRYAKTFLLVVAILATFLTPCFGQPPQGGDPQQGTILEGDDNRQPEVSTPPIGKPPDTPACPEPFPTPAAPVCQREPDVPSYTDKDVDAWRKVQASRPAPVTISETRVVKQFIQNGLSPDTVYRRYEDRFIKPIRLVRKKKRLVALEPDIANDKDRRLNRKLVYDLAVERHLVHWVIVGKQPDGLPIYQARFREDKRDEIVTWIVAESATDAVTAVQKTLRNFILDEFRPLQEQVARHQQVLVNHDQRLQQLEADVQALQQTSGTPPVTVAPTPNPLLAGNAATNTTVANGTAPASSNATAGNDTVNTTVAAPIAPAPANSSSATPTPEPSITPTASTPSPTATASATPSPTPVPVPSKEPVSPAATASGAPTDSESPWVWLILKIVGVGAVLLLLAFLGLRRWRLAAERRHRDAEAERDTVTPPPAGPAAGGVGVTEVHEGEVVDEG